MDRVVLAAIGTLLLMGSSSVLAGPASGQEDALVPFSAGELSLEGEASPPAVPLRGTRDDDRCTPGYDPCIPPGPDVDCAGGRGDGPRYIDGPVYVTGSDPYGLDRDGDGVGCE